MLYELIKANRELLLARSAKLSNEGGENSDLQTTALGHISVFFDQLTDALHVEHGTPGQTLLSSKKKVSPAPAVRLSKSASVHGSELLESNLTIAQVVRNYGNICQAITGYAVEVKATIDPAEFRTLNWCLDEAIAQAVIAFTKTSPLIAGSVMAAQKKKDERLDDLATMVSHVERLASAVEAIRSGRVGVNGATGALLTRTINAMRDLIEKSIDQTF